MRKIVKGDEVTKCAYEQQFEQIYRNHYRELCVYACRFVDTDEEAEELVQEMLFRLWEQREQLDTVKNIRPYLYRSVHNRCLNYIKHKKIEDRYRDEAWSELREMELDHLSSMNATVHNELTDHIQRLVNELPDRCREVFELSRFSGVKNKEIAEQLGISVKAVEAHITKALSTLRQQLLSYTNLELILILIFLGLGLGFLPHNLSYCI